jgi:hypothetical protein
MDSKINLSYRVRTILPPKVKYKTYGHVALGSDFSHFIDKHGNRVTPISLEFNRPCRAKVESPSGELLHFDLTLSPAEWNSRGLNKAKAPRNAAGDIIVLHKKEARLLSVDEIYVEPKKTEG